MNFQPHAAQDAIFAAFDHPGIIAVLVVLQNYIALSAALPHESKSAWLKRFTLVSFFFNVAAFIEQVLVPAQWCGPS